MKTPNVDNDLRNELFGEAIGIITEERGKEDLYFWYKLLTISNGIYFKAMAILIPLYVIYNIVYDTLNKDKVLITVLMFLILMLTYFLKYHIVRSFSLLYYILHKHEHEEY